MVFRAESVIYLILTCNFEPTDRLPSRRGKQRAPLVVGAGRSKAVKGHSWEFRRTDLGIEFGVHQDLLCQPLSTGEDRHARPHSVMNGDPIDRDSSKGLSLM